MHKLNKERYVFKFSEVSQTKASKLLRVEVIVQNHRVLFEPVWLFLCLIWVSGWGIGVIVVPHLRGLRLEVEIIDREQCVRYVELSVSAIFLRMSLHCRCDTCFFRGLLHFVAHISEAFHWYWLHHVVWELCQWVARDLRCVTLRSRHRLGCRVMRHVGNLGRWGYLTIWIPRVLPGEIQVLNGCIGMLVTRQGILRVSGVCHHPAVFRRVSCLTLGLLASTAREDDLFVLIEECLWALAWRSIQERILILVHQGRILLWELEGIFRSEVTCQSIVEILHMTDDV